MKDNICMIGPDITVKGGISSVVRGYLSSSIAEEYSIEYIASHIDGSKIAKLLKALSGYIKFIRICLKQKPDILHIHSSFGASFYRKAVFIYIGKLFKIAVINHIHGAEFDTFYENASPLKKKIVRKVYSKHDVTVVLSQEWKKKFQEIVSKESVIVLENFAPDPEAVYEMKNRENYILFLGEVGRRKGAYDIPAVVEKIVKERQDVKFLVCGNGDIEKVRDILIKRNLHQYVEFKGWIDLQEKARVLNMSKVFFLPTYNEGLPMSILEAMAYGIPVVSTEVGGIPSLVSNGENGYIFKPGSIEEFSKAILKLLEQDELSSSIYINNREKIRSYYSLEANLRKVKEIYNRLLSKNSDSSIFRVKWGNL
jgi:glycosyltransferase involved in cell wall biosynthesis